MFDWNEEELANIVWADEKEGDDHIVPYQERSDIFGHKKEWGQEAKVVKTTEEIASGAKIDLQGRNVERISNSNLSSEHDLGTWPESSVYKGQKTEPEPVGIKVSNSLDETAKSSLTVDELDKGSDIFHSTDKSREDGNFVDWANIGSFDDFDHIFRNGDPLFGTGCLGNEDLWPSSNDVVSSPLSPFPPPLDSSLGLGTDFYKQNTLHFVLNSEVSDLSSQNLHNECSFMNQPPGGKSKTTVEEQHIDLGNLAQLSESNSSLDSRTVSVSDILVEKEYQKNKSLKLHEPLKKNGEARALRDNSGVCLAPGTFLGQLDNSMASPALHSSSSIVAQAQAENPYAAARMYGNLIGPYPAMPMLSSVQDFQSTELRHQLLPISPGTILSPKRPMESAMKPLAMTPQEKIEKLRRRQQMQAMLAIQKQQQQFDRQVHAAELSFPNKNVPQNINKASELVDGANLDDFMCPSQFDSNSPMDQDDAATVNAGADGCPVEYSVLYRLQEVISKLDIGVRLCIRDSLHRLAQSAVQRHQASDTIGTARTNLETQDYLVKEEFIKTNRYARRQEVEAETNPIDRTVAHLLFHRPLDPSGKHPGTPEPRNPCIIDVEGNLNFPLNSKPDSLEFKSNVSQQIEEVESSSHVSAAKNASKYVTPVVGVDNVVAPR